MKPCFIAVATLFVLLVSGCTDGNHDAKAEVEYKTLIEPDKTDSPSAHSTDTTQFNTEEYDRIVENAFLSPVHQPLSTFSIDVDEASYSNVRRFINSGTRPPEGAVRIEEMINYFDYSYPQPEGDRPFSINTEVGDCPWNPSHKLVHIGLQGKTIPVDNLPPANLVFLVDVSGSMEDANKLPLVQASLNLLVDNIREQDRVAIVTYAGNAGVVLESTPGSDKKTIKDAINELKSGGSTAGAEGIITAYEIAGKNFILKGNNRVILATDGDFNVGVSSDDELVRLIEAKRKSGIYLSVLGYGMGNYKDSKMQQLADNGNGNHSYIDNLSEARKVLVREFGSTLFTIAQDVKIQVEFNPARVQAYRLIGYENRMLAAQDFNDDTKDAGELGSGHTVTALYEIIPAGVNDEFTKSIDPLKYQVRPASVTTSGDELLTLKLRYQQPGGSASKLITEILPAEKSNAESTSDNFRFSAAVAEFGLLLRNSAYKQEASYDEVIRLAKFAMGEDPNGYRAEFITLVEKTKSLPVVTE